MTNNMKSVYIGLLFLILIIPFGRLPISFSDTIDLPQLTILYIVFLLFLFICWGYLFSFRGKGHLIKDCSLYLPLGLFILWSILSLKWTVSIPATSTQIFYFIFYFLIFFISLNVVNGDKEKEILLWILLFSTFLVSAYAVHQYFWGLKETRAYVQMYKNEIPLSASGNFMSRLNTNRAFSTFLYPNTLASFLMMIFPFSVFYSIFCKKARIISSIVSLLILFAFILTFSKGGAIALVLSWMIFLIVRVKKTHKIMAVIAFVFLIVLTILFAYNNNYIVDKIKPFQDSLNARVDYWQAGLQMIKEKPLLGFGLGSFGRVYSKYKLPKAEETQAAHNNFLQIWTELGIVGLLIFLSIFVFYFVEMNRRIRKFDNLTSIQKVFVYGGYVSVLSFVLHSLGDFSLYVFNIPSILFMLMGVSCCVNPGGKKLTNKKWFTMPVFIVSFFIIFLLSRVFISEGHYLKTRDSKTPDEILKELKMSVNYCSWGEDEFRMSYHYLLSQIYKQKMFQERIDFTSEMLYHLKQAVKYDRCRSLYWRELAVASLLKKDVDKTLEYMAEAISCYPTYGPNHLFLGDIYLGLDKKDAALKEYKIALEYDVSLKEEIDKRKQEFK